MKIVIIDSGIDLAKDYFKSFSINGFGIRSMENGEIEITTDYNDENGHGTAVANIITRLAPAAEYIICKIFFDNTETSEKCLIAALNYICQNVECDLINISSGIIQCDDIGALKNACDNLVRKNVIIVSAFDNDGAISYPAAFQNVIGVSSSKQCKRDTEFIFVENSAINVYAKGISQNLLWTDPSNMLVSGSSFAAPYVTALIANMSNSASSGYCCALQEIKRKAIKTISFEEYIPRYCDFPIKHAVVFPFNKEMHSLFRFQNQLSFQIDNVYNFKHLGNIGKKVADLLSVHSQLPLIVENITNINWSANFDTFILGHCKEVNDLIDYDVKKEIIDNCIKFKKNLYAFDTNYIDDEIISAFQNESLNIYCPEINDGDVPKKLMGKLYVPSTPIVSVLGTASKQGKFSVQLALRDLFKKNGYKVGQLGSEPTSKLFGFDEVYCIGYNTTVHINGGKSISTVNNMIHNIEMKKPDIIITGAQSNSIPRQIRNLNDIPYNGYEYLLGVNPDCVVLCVDYEDEPEYVQRTIEFIQSLIQSKVLALVLFPLRKKITWSGLYTESDTIADDLLLRQKSVLKKRFCIPVYINGNENDMYALYDDCIRFFTN